MVAAAVAHIDGTPKGIRGWTTAATRHHRPRSPASARLALQRRSFRHRRLVARCLLLSRLAPTTSPHPPGGLPLAVAEKEKSEREREEGWSGNGRGRMLTWHPDMWAREGSDGLKILRRDGRAFGPGRRAARWRVVFGPWAECQKRPIGNPINRLRLRRWTTSSFSCPNAGAAASSALRLHTIHALKDQAAGCQANVTSHFQPVGDPGGVEADPGAERLGVESVEDLVADDGEAGVHHLRAFFLQHADHLVQPHRPLPLPLPLLPDRLAHHHHVQRPILAPHLHHRHPAAAAIAGAGGECRRLLLPLLQLVDPPLELLDVRRRLLQEGGDEEEEVE
uniref:Uncharacterized protein n=1 Tax=Oryza nivara TaxID=4536 RepID=A0A0E0FF40_ORYNI